MTATTIPETEMTGTHSSEETRAMLFVENTFVASKVDQDLAVVRSAPGEDRTIAEKDLSHSLNEAQTAALNAGGRMEAHTLDLLILLSRRKRIILQTTLSAALLAAIGSALLPNRYAATANILPPQQSQSLAASMIGQLGSFGAMGALAQKDLGLKNPNDLYVGMLRSRTSEDALIRRFDLLRVYHDTKMSDARRDLEDASSIILAKEGFVSISVEDRDRRRAPQIANGYVDELRQLTQDMAITEAGQRRLFFERQLETAKNDLANAEQALKETEQKTGVIQLDGQAKAIIEAVARLRASVAAKEVQLHAMRLFSTEQNPDVELREQELSGLRAELSQLEKRSGVADDAQVSAGNVPAGNVPEAGLLYVRKLRDVKYAETIFELLARQYEAAKLDEAKTAAVIQVLDPAIEPDRKSSPQRAWIVAVASLLGFLGSVGYVFLAEAFARMRTNPDVGDRFRLLKSSFQSGL
jgi:LPS O-antigen subunit length determinant protein (WzzB/FepE family)